MSTNPTPFRSTQRRARLQARLAGHPLAREVTERRFERMIEVALARLASITVVIENLWDPHNAAAVVRTAEALGLDRLHVIEQPNRYRVRRRVLQGADRWIDVERHGSLGPCLERLGADGFLTCAADPAPGGLPVSELPVDRPLAIVLGSEKDGLTRKARDLSQLRFRIPMAGFTGSFNVSVSAAVALWDVTQRRRAALGAAGDLEDDEVLRRVTSWLETDAARAGLRRRAGKPASA